MNEFTKEELETLQWAINEVRYCHPLYEKIQFLIDNYCEHSELYEDLDSVAMRCKKCLEIFDE